MKIVKRILLIFSIFFVVLIGLAIVLPIIYKDQILNKTKEEINKNVLAKVDFEDIDLSLFSHFPNFTFKLNNYQVDGIDDFEGITLAKGASFAFTVDIWTLINRSGPFQIKSIYMEKPDINVLVLPNGKANYDIAVPTDERIKETASETDYSSFAGELQKYAINHANLVYDDRSMDFYLGITDLNHSGKGNFTIDVFDLNTHTDIAGLTVRYGGISYLKNAKTNLDAIFNIDQKNSKYTLKDNILTVNALQLKTDGFVQLKKEDIDMDLDFSTPQSDFKSLWSMIPGAYIEGYESVQASGTFELAGKVKGTYSSSPEQLPGFDFHIAANEAKVKYPALPLSISNINAKADISSPGTDLDKMQVKVPHLGFRLGKNPFDVKFNLTHPISNPTIDGLANGVIDLGDISKAMPIEGIDELSGIIAADVKLKVNMKQMEAEDYENMEVRGDAELENLVYNASDLPKIKINTAKVLFSPQSVSTPNFEAQLGKSDVAASGSVDNFLAYFSPEKTMTGDFTLRSNHFYVDEWMPAEETNPSPSTPPSSDAAATEVFDRFDFKMDAEINHLEYDVYQLDDLTAKGRVRPNKMEISNFQMKMGDNDLQANGNIENVFDYLFKDGVLKGDMNIQSNYFDLNPFMTEDGSAPPASGEVEMDASQMEPFLVPEHIDMKIHANMDKVIYTNMELDQAKGDLVISTDRSVTMENIQAKTLGGDVSVSGGYYTADPEKPRFALNYDFEDMDFKQSFNTFNSFEKFAPIGKYMRGSFNTNMKMEGILGKDMMPEYSSISADGFLQTINSVIAGFTPLEKITKTLNLSDEGEKLKIKDSKNWFSIKNGMIEVKEFDYKLKDIPMKIKGAHGLNQEMDYQIKAQVPAKYLKSSGLSSLAQKGLGELNNQAGKLGLNIGNVETLNVLITMTGNISDPKLKLKLLGADGETSMVDAVKEEVKEKLQEKKEEVISDVKGKASEEAKKILEKAQIQADKITAEAKKDGDKLRAEGVKAGNKIRNEGKSAADKVRTEGDNAAEKARQAGYDQAKKLEDQAKNPLAKMAAKKAADKLRKETDKKVAQLKAETEKKAVRLETAADTNAKKAEDQAEIRAKQLEDTAQKKADKIMEDARARAKKLE